MRLSSFYSKTRLGRERRNILQAWHGKQVLVPSHRISLYRSLNKYAPEGRNCVALKQRKSWGAEGASFGAPISENVLMHGASIIFSYNVIPAVSKNVDFDFSPSSNMVLRITEVHQCFLYLV